MTRMLHRVGGAQKTLDLIPSIVNSCSVCREWAKPLPDSASNMNIPDAFNQQIECDLMFSQGLNILHLIDRCTRWHAAAIVPDKSATTLTTTIDRIWFSIHGPPREFIMDGEPGITKDKEVLEYLAHRRVKLHIRAPGQRTMHRAARCLASRHAA